MESTRIDASQSSERDANLKIETFKRYEQKHTSHNCSLLVHAVRWKCNMVKASVSEAITFSSIFVATGCLILYSSLATIYMACSRSNQIRVPCCCMDDEILILLPLAVSEFVLLIQFSEPRSIVWLKLQLKRTKPFC